MGGFLSLCSARFATPVNLASGAPPSPACRLLVGGTDADYPPQGLPVRRKTEFHWLGVWPDEASVDAHLAAFASNTAQLGDAVAVRSLKLLPYARRGADVLDLEVHGARPAGDEPIAIVTTLGIYTTEAEAIAASGHFRASRLSLSAADGLLSDVLILPFPPVAADLITLTTWRSEAAARNWAYRAAAHRGATEYYRGAAEQPRVSFTRCRIGILSGNW